MKFIDSEDEEWGIFWSDPERIDPEFNCSSDKLKILPV